jgi:hypothetical protein
MAIRKYKEGDEVKVGQFVNFEGMNIHTFASVACEVVAVKPKSVDVLPFHEEAVERQKLKRLIIFVCDTKEESERMRDASRAFLKLAMQKEDEYRKELARIKSQMIEDAIQ